MHQIKVKTDELLTALKEKGITQSQVAMRLDIQLCTAHKKLHGKVSFTAEELWLVLQMLNLELVAVNREDIWKGRRGKLEHEGTVREIIKSGKGG